MVLVGEMKSYNREEGFSLAWLGGEVKTYKPEFMREEIEIYREHIRSKTVNLGFSLDFISSFTVTIRVR